MKYTENFNLNLPEVTDQFRVEHQNENINKIDEELNRNASQTEAGRMSASDKKKLDSIAFGADKTVVDSELSETSENAIQNKVVTAQLAAIKSEEEALKKSVSDGKTSIANAITGLGIETAIDASFATLKTNIESAGMKRYNEGAAATKVGNATAGDVVAGKTFTSENGVGLTGAIVDRSNTIQIATTDTSDTGKSCFCINGTDLWVVPAKGFWNNWNWVASRITLPAANIGVTADKIVKGKSICNVVGTAESGIGVYCEPITNLTINKITDSIASLSWTLPSDSKRSGVVVCYSEESAPITINEHVGFDTNTFIGTNVTSCNIDTKKEGYFYFSIFTYTYINNERYYVRGSSAEAKLYKPKGFKVLTSSNTFTVPDNVYSIDVFLVGGGYAGLNATSWVFAGGAGGDGGKILTQMGISVAPRQQFSVTIGAGNGGNSLFGNYSSENGSSVAHGNNDNEKAGEDGVYAFNDSELNGIKYGAAGGAGQLKHTTDYGQKTYHYGPGIGGTTGGGTGATYGSSPSGTDGTGSGGGGGWHYYRMYSDGTWGHEYYGPGSGGSGAVIVRWGY